MANRKQVVKGLTALMTKEEINEALKRFPTENFKNLTDDQVVTKIKEMYGLTGANSYETQSDATEVGDTSRETKHADANPSENDDKSGTEKMIDDAKTKVANVTPAIHAALRDLEETPAAEAVGSFFGEAKESVIGNAQNIVKGAAIVTGIGLLASGGALVYANRTNIANAYKQVADKWNENRRIFTLSKDLHCGLSNTKLIALCLSNSTSNIHDLLRVCAPFGLTPAKVVDVWNDNRDETITYVNMGYAVRIDGRVYANRPYYYEIQTRDPRVGQLINQEI